MFDDRLPPRRRIAVVPAYNEEPTVVGVLDKLYGYVDELVVVDDGSTDRTRDEIRSWLPGREQARLLVHEVNRGMSEAYYTAFTDLRRRLAAGEIDADDVVYTVDADGQHDLAVLEDLHRLVQEEGLDALIVRRDLSTYPRYKQLGNWVMSTWGTLWAGQRLYDIESGYRIFRVGALVDALDYYRGYKYSETVEVAVVLCRRGRRVRNDVLVPVPVFRSRTRMKDVGIDLWMMVVAAVRATRPLGPVRQAQALAVPVAVTGGLAAGGLSVLRRVGRLITRR
jgi:glycosyltransferase involved in cell wall biosynthesis